VEAYQKRGINVYERLWSDQQPRIDVHEHLREDQQLPNGVPSLVRYFEAKGFRFTKEQVVAFYAALKTKGFVILSGLSGTGKTKLAQLFAELLCPCSKCHKSKEETEGEMQAESQKQTEGECKTCTHLFLSVRPDWRDSKALLGYYNPLTGNYESTPLLRFLQQACEDYKNNKDKANPYFVILDEMNLAHVEYYFADFLSVLESGRDEEGWTKEALRLHSFSQSLRDQDGNEIPPTLPLPPNLYIIGTVNIDETTYMFSPKVLDRAFTLEFREVNFSNYPPEGVDEEEAMRIAEQIRGEILDDLRNGGKFCAMVADKNKVREALQNLGDKKAELEELNGILQPYDLHFGYRVLDEIALFVQNAKEAPDVVGKLDEDEEKAKDKAPDKAPDKALDYAVLMKVLPKFHGPRQKLEKPLREVLKWAAEENVPDWVKDTSKPIGLEQVTEALRKMGAI
jgi:GTPase subunit of restriction endonuclease